MYIKYCIDISRVFLYLELLVSILLNKCKLLVSFFLRIKDRNNIRRIMFWFQCVKQNMSPLKPIKNIILNMKLYSISNWQFTARAGCNTIVLYCSLMWACSNVIVFKRLRMLGGSRAARPSVDKDILFLNDPFCFGEQNWKQLFMNILFRTSKTLANLLFSLNKNVSGYSIWKQFRHY